MGLISSKIKIEDIDANGDGIITKSEVYNYVNLEIERLENVYNKRMEDWKEIYEQKLNDKEEKFITFKNILESELSSKEIELEEWKQSYDDLYSKYSELLENIQKENYDPYLSQPETISQSSVERTVDEILSNPNLNLKRVPDWIEKKLYFNIIWITLLIIQKVLSSVKVGALGHEFGVIINSKE